MTRVTYGAAYLRSLPGYENVKLNVEITDDLRDGESVDDGLDRVASKVEQYLTKKINEVDERAARG